MCPPLPTRMASSPSADRTPTLRLIAAGAGAAIVLVAIVAVVALRPHGDDAAKPARFQSADKRFSLALPAGWHALRGAALAKAPSAPAAVVRRTDGTGLIVVHERPALASSSRSLT